MNKQKTKWDDPIFKCILVVMGYLFGLLTAFIVHRVYP